jgi:ribosomal protein S11
MLGFVHIKKNASNHFITISNAAGHVLYTTSLKALHLNKSVLTKTGERLLYTKIIKSFLTFNFKSIFLKLEGLYTEEDTVAILKRFRRKLKKKKISFFGIRFIEKLPHNGCRGKKKKIN